MKKPYYITLTIPYVNAVPHIGYALEAIQGDTVARYQRMLGKNVHFVYGTDENSLKNVQAALRAGEDVKSFVDRHAKAFEQLHDILNLSNDSFIRTTEARHIAGAQKLWQMCNPDDIYKKTYNGLYCVGCESFYAKDDLIQGLCPEHNTAPDEIEEENYFFRLSKYQAQLEHIFLTDTVRIVPEGRKNEMMSFIRRGLEDFSISRSVERAHGWGVPVPGDMSQIMYVWFDALTNYLSVLDFDTDGKNYSTYWLQPNQTPREVVHVLGKGVSRFHLIYWLGMLLSANIPLPTEEFVHGYITVNGQKMSKSLGNVLDPSAIVDLYGQEPFRYYMLAGVSAYQDGDFSDERFKEIYASDLANGIGNLTSRVITMLIKYNKGVVPKVASNIFDIEGFWSNYKKQMADFAFHDVIHNIQTLVTACDTTISVERPWEKAEQGLDVKDTLYRVAEGLRHIALALLPIMPYASGAIFSVLGLSPKNIKTLDHECAWGLLLEGTHVKKPEPLFPRL